MRSPRTPSSAPYSTVTLLAKFRGLSTSVPRAQAVCAHVVAGADSLVVEDVARDPRFGDNPMLAEHGLRFYAGVPLRDGSGAVLGSFALLDSEPRVFSPRELRLLEAMGKDLMATVLDPGEAASAGSLPHQAPDDDAPSATVGQPVPP